MTLGRQSISEKMRMFLVTMNYFAAGKAAGDKEEREHKTMSGIRKRMGRYIFPILLTAASILAGCGQDTLPPQQADGGQTVESPYMEPDSSLKEESAAEAEISEEDTAEPVLAEENSAVILSTGEEITWAMYSEGCYCYYNGSLYGYLSEDGKEISPCIYTEATPFSEGLACVRLDGKYGYIGKDGETVLPFCYDQASPFREGTAYFSCGEEYGLIDREGNVALRLEGCDSISSFREGLAYFSVDGHYGYMDQEGRIVIEPVYDDAGFFYGGLAKVRRGPFFGMVGKDGREVLLPEYNSIRREGTYIIAERDGLYYCFDRAGGELSLGAWDYAYEWNGMLLLRRDGRYGLADESGKLIMEPVYEELTPISGKDLVIVRNENREYGILDYEGQVRVPFMYQSIFGDDSGGLRVTDRDTGKTGYLDGEDFSLRIPMDYDYIGSFVDGRAVVGLGEKYGVIRCDGTLELSPKYDRIKLFSDGSRAAWKEGMAWLTDRQGGLILSGVYERIEVDGYGYRITEDGKAEYRDRQGKRIVSDYTWGWEQVYEAENTYIVKGNILLRTGQEDGQSTEKAILSNWITPRVGLFAELLKKEAIAVADGELGHTMSLDWLGQRWWSYSKLCRIEGHVVLYFYARPWKLSIFPESYSGLFCIRDGQAEQLISGYECGGSLRGDYVCIFYDREDDICKAGTCGSWGGFGGFAHGIEVYSLQDGQAAPETSLQCCNQTVGNYDEEKLLENAELFYDGDEPYTRETILEAEYVDEYSVDGRQTTMEEYRALKERYPYCMMPEWEW